MVASTLWTAAGRVGAALSRTMADLSGTAPASAFATRRTQIARLRAYFFNEGMYSDAAYRREHRLPRAIDGAVNPTRRACNFYAGRIFDGAWTEDGKPLPDGTPHAVPFAADVLEESPDLVRAAVQLLDWSNFRRAKHYYVREGAMVGTVVLELADEAPDPDVPRSGRVYLQVVPLERIADVDLDSRGFVTAYALEYPADDPDTGRRYRYRKEVDKRAIRTYRDDRPDAFGDPEGPERANPYGFCPAWWVKHQDVGGLWGAPAIDGVVPKIDRANVLATGAHQFVNRFTRQPLFFRSDEPVTLADLGVSGDDADPADRLLYLQGPRDADVSWLMQPMPLADARELLAQLLEEIEADLPEIAADERLREMSQVTAPGVRATMGDVRARYREAQAGYTAGLVSAMTAGVAVAGWRLASGAWGPPNRQQQAFAGFDLTSYDRGELRLALDAPDLWPESEAERLANAETRRRVYDLSASFLRRQDGVFAGTEAEVEAQNARVEEELAAEVGRSAAMFAPAVAEGVA